MAKQNAKQFLVSQNVPMFIADPASDSAQLVCPIDPGSSLAATTLLLHVDPSAMGVFCPAECLKLRHIQPHYTY